MKMLGNCPGLKFFCNSSKTFLTCFFPIETKRLLAAVCKAIDGSFDLDFFNEKFDPFFQFILKRKRQFKPTLLRIISFEASSIHCDARDSSKFSMFSRTIFSTEPNIDVLCESLSFFISRNDRIVI